MFAPYCTNACTSVFAVLSFLPPAAAVAAAIDDGTPFNQAQFTTEVVAFESNWVQQTGIPLAVNATGNATQIALALLQKYFS